MDIQFNATVDLKPSDVEKVLKDALEEQFKGFTIKSVEFEIGNESRGYGYGEYTVAVFKGVKVKLEPKFSHDARGPG